MDISPSRPYPGIFQITGEELKLAAVKPVIPQLRRPFLCFSLPVYRPSAVPAWSPAVELNFSAGRHFPGLGQSLPVLPPCSSEPGYPLLSHTGCCPHSPLALDFLWLWTFEHLDAPYSVFHLGSGESRDLTLEHAAPQMATSMYFSSLPFRDPALMGSSFLQIKTHHPAGKREAPRTQEARKVTRLRKLRKLQDLQGLDGRDCITLIVAGKNKLVGKC